MQLFAYHWAQWTLFGIMAFALAVFVLYCAVIDPRKQRNRLWREKSYFDAFMREMQTDNFRLTEESYYWQRLTPHYRWEAIGKIQELLSDKFMDAYELKEAISHLRSSPLSESIPSDCIQAAARSCLERNPNDVFGYEMAREAWGTKNIPTDILLKLLDSNIDKDVILQNESRPENQAELATHIAKKGEWEYLEDLFGEGNFPEAYVRTSLETELQKDEKQRSNTDVLNCYVLLKEWDNLLAFAAKNGVPSDEILDLVREAPADIRNRLATQLAEEGQFWNLIQLFNSEADLNELDMPPPVVPPEPLLRTCLQRLKRDMASDAEESDVEDGLFERSAAECAMLLKDLAECQEIADHCVEQQYADLAGQLLCFIHRTRREQSLAGTSA